MDISKNAVLCNELREKAEKLVNQMTPEEMVYQTVHSAPPIERLGIKGYDWWNEGLHGVARAGVATVFPQAIGMAATFDEELLEKVADAVSTEARAKYNMQQKFHDYGRYKGLTLWAPNINIFRDPRWGRGHETYGEDPYLTSRLGARYVEGLQDYLEKHPRADGKEIRVLVSEGCHLYKEGWKTNRTSEVEAICEASDVVILCMGLDATIEGEQGDAGNDFASGDKMNLNLPGEQQQIVETAAASGKPVVLLYLSGSALTVGTMEERMSAVMQCWYPGAQGGKAIANVLFGEASPQGHLPVTFYRTTEELPDFTDYSMENRTYRYMKNLALYPFGYGLSYTSFEYSEVAIRMIGQGVMSQAELEADMEKDIMEISATVRNTGTFDSRETVQVYVKAPRVEGRIPNAQLKAFAKVSLKAGEVACVKLMLNRKAFTLVNSEGERFVPKGTFIIYVGGSQPDERSVELMGKAPQKIEIEM